MRVDGRVIAQEILENLRQSLKTSNCHPCLTVILVGENPASFSFIKQKQKAAEFIGAEIIVKNFPNETKREVLIKTIEEVNKDPKVDGLIVQLPLPSHLDPKDIIHNIKLNKDVDGFRSGSVFTPSVALAVLKILRLIPKVNRSNHIIIIGRGLTAGKPIAETLKKEGFKISLCHSQTENLGEKIKNADIVISCVGKPNIIKTEMLKTGAIIIGVGVHRNTEGKLAGDFNEEEISKVAVFYTPTPGGIGPVNVACLMENLVKAANLNSQAH